MKAANSNVAGGAFLHDERKGSELPLLRNLKCLRARRAIASRRSGAIYQSARLRRSKEK